MGRGGAKVVSQFRNMETGSIVDRTFNSTEKLQDVYMSGKPMQYLYKDGSEYMFMDMETFEQLQPAPRAGRRRRQIHEGKHGRGSDDVR